MNPVSSMVLLPDFTGNEHGEKSSINTSSIVRTPQQRGLAPLSTDMSRSRNPKDDPTTTASNPPKMATNGRRVVMATGVLTDSGKQRESASGLCLLEHGFGLDATEEGRIGLPEGSTLFAQPVILTGDDHPNKARPNRPLNDDDGSDNDRGGGKAQTTGFFRHVDQRRHVLLLSDRVRSKTHVLETSSCGEVAPAASGVSGCDSMY